MTAISFKKHYVTNGTHKARVHYSHCVLTNGREAVTLYAKDCRNDLHLILAGTYENATELQDDYFEKGRARIYPDSPLWGAAVAAASR